MIDGTSGFDLLTGIAAANSDGISYSSVEKPLENINSQIEEGTLNITSKGAGDSNQIFQNAPVIEIIPSENDFTAGPGGVPNQDNFLGLTLDGDGLDLVSDSNIEIDGFDFNFLADLGEIIPGFPVSGFGGTAIAEAVADPLSAFGPASFFNWAAIFDGGSPTIVI